MTVAFLALTANEKESYSSHDAAKQYRAASMNRLSKD